MGCSLVAPSSNTRRRWQCQQRLSCRRKGTHSCAAAAQQHVTLLCRGLETVASPQQREACWTVLVVVTLGMQGGSGMVYVGASAFWAWVDSNLAIENGTAQLASQVVDERIW